MSERKFDTTCRHFTGILGMIRASDPTCAVGVMYQRVRGKGEGYPFPCTGHPELPCPKRRMPTPEEIEAHNALLARAMRAKIADQVRKLKSRRNAR